MAKANPERQLSKQRWLDSDGTATTRELATAAGVSVSLIRKWKSEDKWKEALGGNGADGRTGNANAKGHGAPPRNANAVTHGAYTTIHLDSLDDSTRVYVEAVGADTAVNMQLELRLLYAKEYDLKNKIAQLEAEEPGVLHVERVIETEGKDGTSTTTESASAFEHIMRLNAELNKIHGRIIKVIDMMKSYELENRRLELDEKRYELSKQKLSGEFTIEPDIGEPGDPDDIDEIDGSDD